MITYRKATTHDYEALAKIRMDNMEKYMNDATDESKINLFENIKIYFRDNLSDGSLVTWLACDGNNIVSTSGLTFFSVTPSITNIKGKQGYITNMYTYPEYRCQGIGSKLFELTVLEAEAHGCERIVLYKTSMAENIYKNYGFEDSIGYMTFKPS